MNYHQSLDYLYGLQRFGIKLGLKNIQALLDRLGNPDRSYGIIHVAGTNGKGSVSSSLAEVLKQAGYRVGLYTSPHLHSFTERIRINGVAIEEAEVAALTDIIRDCSEEIPATFFEFTTALALLHFKRQEVDFVVLEVGMGGRLDATNAVNPVLSVITSICRDHSEYLGEDLREIAAEKAGIIKEGVPLIIGRQTSEVLEVLLAKANKKNVPFFCLGEHFAPEKASEGFSYRGLDLRIEEIRPGLKGRHQHDNLSIALCVAELLCRQGADLTEQHLRDGVEGVFWPGRLEWWQGKDEVLLDGTHNGAGAMALADYLKSLGGRKVRWVVGLKGDKFAKEVLAPVLPYVRFLYCTEPPVENAVSPSVLCALGQQGGVAGKQFDDTGSALTAALNDRQSGELVVVAGSLFLVAAAREALSSGSFSCDPFPPRRGEGACCLCES